MTNENARRPGFQIPMRTLAVDFTGGEYEGAEVRLRLDVPLRTAFHFQQLGDTGEIEALLREFGDDILKDWNLEDDQEAAIPATADGLMGLPASFGMLLVEKWTAAMNGGDSPLGKPSPNGDTLAAQPAVTDTA